MEKQASWQEIYEHRLTPAIFGPWSTKTLALAIPQDGDSVLDVACGTGIVTRLAAKYVGTSGHIVGLDVNPGMIETARTLPAPHGISSIDWQVGDAQQLPFSNATFHIVFCQGGLQFVPDRSAALQEMFRVLKPGGKVAIMVLQHIQYCPGFAIVFNKLTNYVDWQKASLFSLPFTLGDVGKLRSLIVNAGFQDVIIRPEVTMIRFPSPTAFVQSLITGSSIADQVDSATLTTLTTEVNLELQPFVKNDELSFPMGGYLVVAHK